jgi:hypothetical protein
MPVIWRKNGKPVLIGQEKINGKNIKDKEKTLQELIAEKPGLLHFSNESPLFLIDREIKLNCGDIDILLVNREGRITIVEVKLEKNPEIDRHILGQIVDYASSLTLLQFEELNTRTLGKLDKVLNEISLDDEQYHRKREHCTETLNRGIFQLIIAVDNAPNELLRKWLYESAHTDLDLRLVTIQKYQMNEGEELITSNILVSREAHRVRNPKATPPNLLQVIEHFEKINVPSDWKLKKSGPTNYAIFMKNWPDAIHYEFNYWEKINLISLEIMVKKKALPQIPDAIYEFKESLSKKICGDVRWCPDRGGWSRLAFLFSADTLPVAIAKKMAVLISLSHPEIDKKIIN